MINRKLTLVLAAALTALGISATTSVGDLRVNTLKNPSGIENASFSWKLVDTERGVKQTAYTITVSRDAAGGDVAWTSGTIESDASVNVIPTGMALQPGTRYYWSVSVKTNLGGEATSTEKASFITGLMDEGWGVAKWISASSRPYSTEATDPVTDYTIDFDFEVEHTAAGFCFAKHSEGNFYMWQFNTIDPENPRFRPHSWSNGNPALLAEVPIKDKVHVRNGNQYHARLVITDNGSRCATYINDVLIDERTGNFSYGTVGMRQDFGDYDMRPEIAIFDNINVARPSGEVLFTEDFTSTNHFSVGEVIDGRLRIVGSTSGSVYSWQTASASGEHYIVECDMTLLAGNAAVVFAGTNGISDLYMWQFNTINAATPLLRRHVKVNNNYVVVNDIPVTAFSKADLLGTSCHLKIEVNGACVDTYIDDVKVDSYTSTQGHVAWGNVGLRVCNIDDKEDAYFDNILVTRYDANNVPKVVINETFEAGSTGCFLMPEVVEVDGNHLCHMTSIGTDHFMMQTATESAPFLFKPFEVSQPVVKAMLHTSGLGVYDAYINGSRVGHLLDDGTTDYVELKPGWTDYSKRVFYSTHDVTSLINEGQNVIGASITSGWWAGVISKGIYGNVKTAFIGKLVLTFADGTEQVIVTDNSWATSLNSPILKGDIYDGELYDSRRHWSDINAESLSTAKAVDEMTYNGAIDPYMGPTPRALFDQAIAPQSVTIYNGTIPGADYGMINVISTSKGEGPIVLRNGETAVVDFGQNLAGWPMFTVKGAEGTTVKMRFAEMLNDTGERSRGNDGPGGSLYLQNLRSAKAELYYIVSDDSETALYHPTTTFYGYRYCEITANGDVEITSIKSVPVTSSHDDAGTISTDNAMVNRLIQNIVWGQRSNLLSVPTDCPQRDERLGWTADTQVFANTGMFNAVTTEFYRKWLTDMRDSQRADGAYYDIAPVSWTEYGNGAWADAGVIVPWNVYQMTGDKSIIEESYASMTRFMTWLSQQSVAGFDYPGGGTAHGDWLSFVETSSRFVSMAYYAYDAQLMAKMAAILSQNEGDQYSLDAAKYTALANDVKAELQTRFMSQRQLRNFTQTQCVLALHFNLCKDDAQRQTIIERLSDAITKNGEKLNTGFVGTAYINMALSQNGLSDKAYNLLLQRECPSWLYSIDQGATTMWERWNSYTKETGFGDAAMNSFNHYAYGAVGEWMWRYMVGISNTEEQPGFSKIVYAPNPDFRSETPAEQPKINQAVGTLNTPYGIAEAEWKVTGGTNFTYDILVPANTIAELRMPVDNADIIVYEDGKPAEDVEGIEYVGYEEGRKVFTLPSGSYSFAVDGTSAIPDVLVDFTAVNVYPNPVKDVLHIVTEQPVERASLVSISGATLATWENPGDQLDLSAFPSGTFYILTVTTPAATTPVKVFKQ